jgi:DNA-binding CsgD family transcriptional regulator
LAGLLDRARGGRAGILLLHGDPGVGKSALLEDLVAGTGSDVSVLRAQGVESEAPLAFAALHRLLRPVLGLLDRIPAPQARALRAAFGEEDDLAVQPFLVALATLSLLTEVSETGPVLCVVDDAQWLDQATAEAVLMAARRLDADPVVVVLAARDGEGRTFAPADIPSTEVKPLTEAAARAVLAEATGGAVSEHVADQLVAESAGNPLALVEFPTTLTDEQLAGAAVVPAQLALTAAMERVFLDRCRRLPPAEQALLLLVAADDSGRVRTVRRAAAHLDADPDAFDAVERSGLLVIDGDAVRVRHPLVRSAVYQAATRRQRRDAHRALADALATEEDVDRYAWHRAAATESPDDEVGADLEAAAVRAERRGGHAAAAAAYERAAELTASDPPRAARLFAAARNAWEAGHSDDARRLCAASRERADDPVLRADIDRLRGRIEVNVGSATAAHRIFTSAAAATSAHLPDRSLELAVAAALLRTWGTDSGATLDVAPLVARSTAAEDARTRTLGHLLLALTHTSHGRWGHGLGSLHAALDAGAALDDPDVLSHLGNTALHLGDDQAHRRCFVRMATGARDAGAGMLVLYALPRLGFTQHATGTWTELRGAAEEALSLSISTGQRPLGAVPAAWLTLLAVLQGRPDAEYRTHLGDVDAAATQPLGVLADPVHDLHRWAQGTRAAHDGDTRAALHHFGSLRLSALTRLVAVDRIDAAVRAGDRELAATWVDELVPFAEGTGWSWALAAVDHGRALLADPAAAPAWFDSALAHHARPGTHPYDRARTQLAYGEFLRRAQRRVDARHHLRSALELFEDLHAAPLAARATQELRASGETARKRNPSTLLTLTPMERQIAELVGKGLSNKDVAAQCWVSHRTVAFHLRNIFSKVGVTSRGELTRLQLS